MDLEAINNMAQAQAESHKILAKALAEQPKLQDIKREIEETFANLIRKSSEADRIVIQSVRIEGDTARALTKSKRNNANEITVDGVFRVDAADSRNPDGFF